MNDSGFHVYDGSRLKSEWPDVDTSVSAGDKIPH